MTTTPAVLTRASGDTSLVTVDLADPGPDQVEVRVAAAGVCHSDLSARDGTMAWPSPMVLGHEGAGIVTRVGSDVEGLEPGDRVAFSWIQPCRDCRQCRRSEPWLCERSAADVLDRSWGTVDGEVVQPFLGVGAFAEHTLLLARGVVRVPPDLSLEQAALVSCAATTGYGAVRHHGRIRPRHRVAVVGCGGVGLSIVQHARLAGADQVVAVDLSPDRLALARELGATHVVDPSDGGLVGAVREVTDGEGVDVAFEAVGRSSTIRDAMKVTRRGGTVVVVGVGRADDMVEVSAMELFWMARTVVGSVFGGVDPDVDLPRVMELVRDGRVDVDRLVTHRIALEDVPDAFTRMEQAQGLRSVVTFDGWEDVERRLLDRQDARELPTA